MRQIHVEASAIINARPEEVYAILANYHEGHHPAILPQPYFTELAIERGGQGAGTVIRVRMKVLGVERTYHLEVSEPEPGRVLVEADEAAGVITTFTVDPLNDGQQSRVTIASDTTPASGFMGFVERLVNPPITRHIYRKELEQLDEWVQGKGAADEGSV
jgi:hypothetical protein